MKTRAAEWLADNLFPSVASSAVTIILGLLCIDLAYELVKWVLVDAKWYVITENIRIFLIGTFPTKDTWRVWLAADVLGFLFGGTMVLIISAYKQWKTAIVGLLVGVAVAYAVGASVVADSLLIVASAYLGWVVFLYSKHLRKVLGIIWIVGMGLIWELLLPGGLDNWGGLLLSVLVTVVAAVLSLPLGILLALGRRSRFPAIRWLSVGYIELLRSLPLISVLYWAWIVVPLVLPPHFRVPDLVRGMAGFVLFYAAYVAEYVRGGLQSVPAGQFEAAHSLGLGGFQSTYYVVLPQALRTVIPALVGNVLDIFNNVPLVFIIGLTDFLKAGETVLADPQYIGREYEVYAFLFAVYLVSSGLLSYAARRLERRLGVGER